jgi:actin-related protein 5
LANELRAVFPLGASIGVRKAADPILDAWKGAAGWWSQSGKAEREQATVSRAEYMEKGSEYYKVR